MSGSYFIDTNVAIYALEASNPKSLIATSLLSERPVMSTQVIMESVNVLIKKFKFTKQEAFEHAKFLIFNSTIVSVTQETVMQASEISDRYGYSHWDSLIVASALSANCEILYSEDFKDQQLIDKKMIIQNPFTQSR